MQKGFITPLVIVVLATLAIGGIYLAWHSNPQNTQNLSGFSDPYLSYQLATTSLTNGYILQTDGTNSTWVATSSLGITGTGGGLATTSPFTTGDLVQVTDNGTVNSIATTSLGLLTTNVAEGSNLYYTLARVQSALIGGYNAIFGNSTTTNLSIGSLTGLLKGTGGNVSTATAGVDYQLPLTFSSPLSETSQVVSLPQASTTANGYMSASTTVNLIRLMSTGLVSGGELATSSATTFSIDSGTAQFVDAYTDPNNPTITYLNITATSSIPVTNLATWDSTFISLDSAGNIYQTQTIPNGPSLRDRVLLGSVIHTSRTQIDEVDIFTTTNKIGLAESISDLSLAIGPINMTGNKFSANGANLQINKSVGNFMWTSINWRNSKKSPNITNDPACTACSFYSTWQLTPDVWVGTTTTSITPNLYDDGTGTVNAPNGVVNNNQWTLKKIYYSPDAQLVVVEYGQEVYNSEAAAEAAKSDETSTNPSLTDVPFRGWIISRGGATNCSLSTDCVFIDAGKFGTLTSGAGSGSSVTTLQGAYDNSSQPQITTDTTRGAVQIKRGSAADTDHILDFLNGSGAIQSFVNGLGKIFIGSNASSTDFPNAQAIVSLDNTGETHTYNMALVGEATASSTDANLWGVGLYGVGRANGATKAYGVVGEGKVSNTNDGLVAGVRGYSTDTHAGSYNIGLYGEATGSSVANYGLYLASGDVYSAAGAIDWDILDNNTSALSFDTTGKTGLLNFVTTNGSEAVTMSGSVGIGTTTPETELSVVGTTTTSELAVGNGNEYMTFTAVNGGAEIGTRDDTRIRFNDKVRFDSDIDGTNIFNINNMPLVFRTSVDDGSAGSKGSFIEWDQLFASTTTYDYGSTTKAYYDWNKGGQVGAYPTFTVPTTGQKRIAWIGAHYASPTSTGEAIHQHMNFETAQADMSTIVTRFSCSYGEDIALCDFPNSEVQIHDNRPLYLSNTTKARIQYETSTSSILIDGAPINIGGGDGNESLTILAQNNSTTGGTLHFSENSASGNGFAFVHDTTNNYLNLQDTQADTSRWRWYRDNGNYQLLSGNILVDGTGNSRIMGNLGMGTTSPEAKLDVWGSSGGKILTLFTNAGSKMLEIVNDTATAVLTGIWDFTSATLRITAGTNPTVDGTGEIAVDTTNGQLIYFDTATTTVVFNEIPRTLGSIGSTSPDRLISTFSTATTTWSLGNSAASSTITSFYARTDQGTCLVRIGDGTNWSATLTASSTSVALTSLTNNTFIEYEEAQLQIGSCTGSPNYITPTVMWAETRQ